MQQAKSMPDILLTFSGPDGLGTPLSTGPGETLTKWLKGQARPLSDDLAPVRLPELLGLPEGLATGPLSALGLGLEVKKAPFDEHWCLASPLHLRADLSSVLLFGPESLAMQDAEAQALADAFNAHFADRGLWLGVHPGQGWLLRSNSALGPALPPAAQASLDIRALGPAVRPWQALLLEIQMLFHGHEINRARATTGQPTINGLWPQGCGQLPAEEGRGQGASWIKAMVANSPWAKGLAKVCGLPFLSMDTPMAAGQLWCCTEVEAPLTLLQQALDWQSTAKGREVWCHLEGQGSWRLERPGFFAGLMWRFGQT